MLFVIGSILDAILFEFAYIITAVPNQDEEELGTILYILPLRVRMYKYPSSGPACISVITPNPCPNTAPPSLRSSGVFAILSVRGPSNDKPILPSFSLKLYRRP